MNAHKKLLLRKTLPPIPTLGLFVYFLGLGLHFFIFGSFLLTFIIKPRLILCFALRSEVDSFARSPMFYFKNCIRRWPPGKNTHIAFSRFPFHFLSEENNFAFLGGPPERERGKKGSVYDGKSYRDRRRPNLLPAARKSDRRGRRKTKWSGRNRK